MHTKHYFYWLALPLNLTIRSYFNFFLYWYLKGNKHLSNWSTSYMYVCFVHFLLPGWLLPYFLLVKRCQRSSNLKSSQSEFNIKLASLQPHKLWDWQNDLLRSWIKLPIYSACAISICCKGTEIWEQWSLNIFDYFVLGLPSL